MSLEITLTCDGCLEVLGGSTAVQELLKELRENGGRAFDRGRSASDALWHERRSDFSWLSTVRHLGACCAGNDKFYDGVAVPPPPPLCFFCKDQAGVVCDHCGNGIVPDAGRHVPFRRP